jgi:selenocysteine lyase/cysteine desulfurase
MIARPGLLSELSGDAESAHPEKFELGTLPVELMDGVTAAVDHLAGLDDTATGTRRQRLIRSLTAAGQHEQRLFAALHQQLSAIHGVTILGASANRVPVLAFTVQGFGPEQVSDHLARQGVAVWTGPHGQNELISAFGADELGGPVLVGIMPHTTLSEVELLASGVQKLLLGGNAEPSRGFSESLSSVG